MKLNTYLYLFCRDKAKMRLFLAVAVLMLAFIAYTGRCQVWVMPSKLPFCLSSSSPSPSPPPPSVLCNFRVVSVALTCRGSGGNHRTDIRKVWRANDWDGQKSGWEGQDYLREHQQQRVCSHLKVYTIYGAIADDHMHSLNISNTPLLLRNWFTQQFEKLKNRVQEISQ